MIAVDGTKLAANASRVANRTATQIAEQILAEAAATDAAEGVAAVGATKGEPGNPLRERTGRRAKLRKLLDELAGEATEKSYQSQMARRAEIEAATGEPIRGRPPSPGSSTRKSRGQANVTDPDSRRRTGS